jgi:hypothetical protein
MRKSINTSGLPRGMGSLQVRGRVYWAIYTDADGRNVQANTQTADPLAARLFLVQRAQEVLEAKLAAVQGMLDECRHQPRATAGAARGQGADRSRAPKNARNRKKTTQGESR